jgi:hypothetical protein
MYDWAEFRTTKGGVKLHLMLEHDVYLPVWAHITEAKKHDQKVLETIDPILGLNKGAFVCVDRAYNDFAMLFQWSQRGINFVCRAKDNMSYNVVKTLAVPNPVGRPPVAGTEPKQTSHVVSDEIIEFASKTAKADYPEQLRVVTYWVEEEEGSNRVSREIKFLTNNFKLSPVTIAAIYQARWQIEAFFKLIKRNLKIKTFLGTSPNAVKTQLFAALITFLILRYWQAMCKTGWCIPHLLAIIRLSLHLHRSLYAWLDKPPPKDSDEGSEARLF